MDTVTGQQQTSSSFFIFSWIFTTCTRMQQDFQKWVQFVPTGRLPQAIQSEQSGMEALKDNTF